MEVPSDWASLLPDLTQLIAARVLAADVVDYTSLRAVCASWRASTPSPRDPSLRDARLRPRGWVALCDGDGVRPADACEVAFLCTATGRCVRVRLPKLRGHRIVGFTDGLLILLNKGTTAVRVLHPFTRVAVDLPPIAPIFDYMVKDQLSRAWVRAAVCMSQNSPDSIAVVAWFLNAAGVVVAERGSPCWYTVHHSLQLASAVPFQGRLYGVVRNKMAVLQIYPQCLDPCIALIPRFDIPQESRLFLLPPGVCCAPGQGDSCFMNTTTYLDLGSICPRNTKPKTAKFSFKSQEKSLKKLSKKKKSQDYEVQGQVPSCILGEVLAAGLVNVVNPMSSFWGLWAKKKIDKIRRSFLWKGEQNANGGHCLVNWQTVTRPKDLGGLGVPDLERFGRTLRLRWLWQEWVDDSKSWSGSELPCYDDDRLLFNSSIIISLEDGAKTKFWHHSWLDGQAPRYLAPNLFRLVSRTNRTAQQELRNNNGMHKLGRKITSAIHIEEFVSL
ncbi:unnamed protein product [Miscanthus lutarioriparius]|uniref:KIB1-4 beta-propeller domain-containing protein n=1 Tax=Miscanthus lutarioriparius TaxID=422564 RepID=A0A811Q7J4_9POAL|nr:unnamed protein product [Miscanthus lutarioriparius]